MAVSRIALLVGLLGIAFSIPASTIAQAPSAQPPSATATPSTTAPPSDPAQSDSAPAALTAEQVESLKERVVASSDLDEAAKAKLLELVERAAGAVTAVAQLAEQRQEYQNAAESAEKRAEQKRTKIEELQSRQPTEVDDGQPLAKLEQQLSELEADVAKDKQVVGETDARIADRTGRRRTIRNRLTENNREWTELQPSLDQTPPEGEAAIVTAARRMEIEATLQRLQAEAATLEAELKVFDAEDAVGFLQLRRDEAALRLEANQRQLASLRDAVQARRAMEAQQRIVAAEEQQEAETNPQLKQIAQRNVELAEQFKTLTEQIRRTEEQLTRAKATRDHWSEVAKSTKEKVEAIGLTDAIGAMLRQQKASLPNTNRYQSNIHKRAQEIADAQLKLFELEDERTRGMEYELTQFDNERLRARAVELASKRSENLGTLTRNQLIYFDNLVELSNVEDRIINATTEYRNFIDQRILWVRSSQPLYRAIAPEREDLWLFNASAWWSILTIVRQDAVANPLWYMLAATIFLLLLTNGRRFRRELRERGEIAENFSCTSMSPTIQAMSYTILISLPWALLLAFLAWRTSEMPHDSSFVPSLAEGLSALATAYLPLEFVRQVCQPRGLGQSHFNWPEKILKLVRRSLRSLMVIGAPLILVIAMTDADGLRPGRDTIQRVLFITAMLALALFGARILNPANGIFSVYLARRPDGWAARLQGVWYWLLVVSPLLIAALSFFGYGYTSIQLAGRLYATLVLLTLLGVITAFLTRALLVHRRHTNIETATQRRAARLDGSELGTDAVDIPTAEELRSQIAQSRSLLRTVMFGIALIGIWMTWVDVLPALSFLEQEPLWRSIKTVGEMETGENGDVQFVTHDIVDNVTIADLAFAILVAIGTALAATNIPGLLEIAVLKRLPLEPSARYAIETVASYAIMLIGLVVACSAVGLHWKQIQWMAAALTFGLAFGLQEMFANFVAGLIILFERPVRVGDIVTVDDVTGTVSRVRIRATTITNWDNKDYLVPNKDFITGRVLNWTLSNRFNRIVLPVGVAYGSDKDETVRQILRVAIEHPLVSEEPAPSVTFEEFGDSSLNYVLRCYISMDDMPSRLKIIHELNTGIDDAFRAAGITIPFPQRDIHIDGGSSEPGFG